MSRSRPNKNRKSPVKHYFDWSGSEGKLFFYNKEEKENVYFPKLNFVLLEGDLHTITGFSKKHNNGIRGTEVRDLNNPITVWIGKNKHSSGKYSDLKSISGLKYAKPLYIAMLKKDGSFELAKLTLKGAAFSAWINFLKGAEEYAEAGSVDPYGEGVGIRIVGKSKMKKNGATKYYEPKFELFDLTDEQDEEAIELDKELQEYFDETPSTTDDNDNDPIDESDDDGDDNSSEDADDEQEDEETEEEHEDAEDVDDLPF